MNSKNTIVPQVGDWICAYQNGILAIAEVRYITKSVEVGHRDEDVFVTDHGTVRMDSILEVRRRA